MSSASAISVITKKERAAKVLFSHQDIIDTRTLLPVAKELLFVASKNSAAENALKLTAYNQHLSSEFDHFVTAYIAENLYVLKDIGVQDFMRIHLNLNHQSLINERVLKNILKINAMLNLYNLRLVIELVEYTNPSKESLYQAEVLQGHGVEIAIDDFGTGYNTVSGLYKFRGPDYIKLVYNSSFDKLRWDMELAMEVFDIRPNNIIVEYIDADSKIMDVNTLGVHHQQGFIFKSQL